MGKGSGLASCLDKVNNNVPLLVAVFVIAGTANTVTNKVLYDSKGNGVCGLEGHKDCKHEFQKPYALNFIMFLGMALCLIPYWLGHTICKGDEEEEGLLAGGERPSSPRSAKSSTSNLSSRKARVNAGGKKEVPADIVEAASMKKSIMLIFFPAACDCVATVLMSVGLLWVSASVWQMFRGAITFFSALIRVCMGLKVHGFEWFGIFIVTSALAMVGVASIKIPQVASDDSDGGSSQPSTGLQILGMGLVLLSQLVQALQTVLEEKLLHSVKLDATLIVGIEGVWGLLLTVLLMVIAQYTKIGQEGNGVYEDSWDTMLLLRTPVIWVTSLLFLVAVIFFNLYGMYINLNLNATARNIMDSIRTAVIWVCMLVAHKLWDDQGEIWDNTWSVVELLGFIVMVFGLFVYNVVVRLPKFEYPPDMEESGFMLCAGCVGEVAEGDVEKTVS